MVRKVRSLIARSGGLADGVLCKGDVSKARSLNPTRFDRILFLLFSCVFEVTLLYNIPFLTQCVCLATCFSLPFCHRLSWIPLLSPPLIDLLPRYSSLALHKHCDTPRMSASFLILAQRRVTLERDSTTGLSECSSVSAGVIIGSNLLLPCHV